MSIIHEDIFTKLNEIVNKGEITHSYIFCGDKGLGQKEVAYLFAKSIMCKTQIEKEKFDNNNHPDFKCIYPGEKDSIKIETIRDLITDINIKPIESEYKVYIIYEANKITQQAQNALLKTLEEPPNYAVIILITEKLYEIIETIRSRSQEILFNKISNKEIIEYIDNMKIKIDIDREILLILINGSIENIKQIKKQEELINMLIEKIYNIEKMNLIQVYEFVKEIVKYRNIIQEILQYAIGIFYSKYAKKICNIQKTNNIIGYIEDAKRQLMGNINYDICIENLFIRIWEECNV